MTKDTSYQGYTNHETWAVALWIDNDEGLYLEKNSMVKFAHGDAYRLSNALKSWVEEMAPELGATLWSDLLTAAIGEVDWKELAEHWISEASE